ncbi:CDK5RAP3 protein homolog [Chironomus tepperi]|uniref:CDK5RAP3 protein homolog n=1 Tax=Chironomus tepperi TaxID=113505 RepID=UPI00391F5F24
MNEQDIPIDIHVNKLSDWLISRRIADKNWQRNIKDVRNKINEALKDMPGNDKLIELLSGSYINYFHCQEIIEILKTTEKDSKNIFGSYSSQRMKDWIAVVKSYEKDNLYLAEAAQLLSRNINYEIPSARKQMTTLEKLSNEALTKSQDAVKSENILKNEFHVACQQLGINGDNIKQELVEKIKDLPDMQDKIVKNLIPAIKSPVTLYQNFCGNKHCLPVLKHLIEKGNTTVYEYKYNEAPIKVEEPPLPFNLTDNAADSNDNNEIDFGDDNGDEGIDFGGDDAEVNLEVGEINWGDDVDAEAGNANEIDFNISLEGSGIVVESDGMSGGVARQDEAYALLDSPNYRDNLLDELYELESFLKLRLYELASSDKVHVISMSLLDHDTDHDAKSINEMVKNIDAVLAALTASTYMQIYQIKHSPKFVDILTNKLKQKLRGIEKFKYNQVAYRNKSVELKESAAALVPNLTKMIEQTKALLKHTEKDISKRYKNRVVNLMGANF